MILSNYFTFLNNDNQRTEQLRENKHFEIFLRDCVSLVESSLSSTAKKPTAESPSLNFIFTLFGHFFRCLKSVVKLYDAGDGLKMSHQMIHQENMQENCFFTFCSS